MEVNSKVGSGRFTLVRALGRGGMGEVWLAQDERLEEPVALKFLPPEVRADPVALQDLRRETARSHRLTHPNIVRIYDLHEEAGGQGFIAMEYVDGMTLSGWRLEQRQQVFAWEQLAPLVQQLCTALEYAHGEGVIHRDLKPANVMLDSKGRVKLADFGIAAVVSDSVSRVSARSSSGGTLAYMSPQQLQGQRPTAADDVYALGATLYELLSVRPPFYRGDITHQVLHVAPTPLEERLLESGIDNPVPPEVAALVMACLAKDPAQRPPGARAVAEWLASGGAPAEEAAPQLVAEPAKSKPQRGLWIGLGVSASIIMLAVAAWFTTSGKSKPKPDGEIRSPQPAGGSAPQNVAPGQRWTNSLGMVFVPVPGTEVLFSIWETRVSDFETFVNATGYDATEGTWSLGADRRYRPRGDTWKSPGFPQGLMHPVCAVNWDDAKAFCTWLTERELKAGRLAMGQSYRLPTDAEWNRAVGLDNESGNTPKENDRKTKGVYPWGNQWPPPPKAGNYGGTEARDETYPTNWATIDGYRDDYARTAPVGSFKPNRHGLFDLSGNVWEWCEDSYDGQSESHFLRGGSWAYDVPDSLLSSYRYYYKTWRVRGVGGGFRVVLAMNSDGALPASTTAAPLLAPSAQAITPTTATKDKPWTNSLGMVFVPVPGTEVKFSIWETRVQDFAAFVDASGYQTRRTMYGHRRDGWKERNSDWRKPGFVQAANHPVVGVNWDDAQAFCRWLTAKEQSEGNLDHNRQYRLPTDAEWSQAVGPDRFPWGNGWPPPTGAGNYGSEETKDGDYPPRFAVIRDYRDGYARTSPVGSFRPNRFGLYDLGGNAWEWCFDWYRKEANDPTVLKAFPVLAADGGGGTYRVYRGGGWNDANGSVLLSANRMGDGFAEPSKRYDNTGFRCVLAPTPPE